MPNERENARTEDKQGRPNQQDREEGHRTQREVIRARANLGQFRIERGLLLGQPPLLLRHLPPATCASAKYK